MKVTLQLTAHPTNVEQQIEKINEELKEVNEAFYNNDVENTIDELIDLAKCSMKLAVTLCESQNSSIYGKIDNNNHKNEIRGYHDVGTFNKK